MAGQRYIVDLIEGNDREILYQAKDESWTVSLIALFSHFQSVLKAKNVTCETIECYSSLIIESINLIVTKESLELYFM